MTTRRTVLKSAPALLLSATPAWAQSFPTRPIRYIVPVPPGGGSDFVGRTVTERWGKALEPDLRGRQPGGGGGIIACADHGAAAPDGYTLMQGYVATHGTSPATRKLPYDAIKDFTPIGMIGGTPNVLVVNAALPVNDLKGFVDYLKQNPGKVELRLGRHRLADAPDDGAVQAAVGHLHGARALPRHRTGVHRPDRRPDAGDVPGPGRGGAAHPLRPRARRWPSPATRAIPR